MYVLVLAVIEGISWEEFTSARLRGSPTSSTTAGGGAALRTPTHVSRVDMMEVLYRAVIACSLLLVAHAQE